MEKQKKWMIHFRDSPFARIFQLTDNTKYRSEIKVSCDGDYKSS